MWWRRTSRGIACQELVELVTAYLDGALPAADRARFEAHLAHCEDCTAYVAQFAQTLNALGAMPRPEPDARALDALLAVFRGRPATARRNGRAAPGTEPPTDRTEDR
jgi:anti-sigma factor RsiW